MPCSPIVYLGPSLSRREAAAVLPGADLREPVKRWDLYHDREAGSSLFVVLDGVFFQHEAISPREVVDVLADGATIVGAASMGALRAAECWPAGMKGVGTIYRLFRSGLLTSDDEVAVVFSPTFSPTDEHSPLSVPLINVRYAARRAVRQGWMAGEVAQRLVRAAEETHYAERSWPDLLARVGASADGLATRLAALDLKRMDALRALRRVARWLAADPGLTSRPRRGSGPFALPDRTRESGFDALIGSNPEAVRRGLVRWLLVSGRGARHLLAVAAARPDLGLVERWRSRARVGSLIAELRREPPGGGTAGAAALHTALFELWVELSAQDAGEGLAAGLWAELALAGELDAEILRWRAVREGAGKARELGLVASAHHRYLAEMEIADAHGFPSWRDLREAARRLPLPWARLIEYREELALAKRLREALFSPHRPADPH
jgi:hypothetical protein